VDLDRVWEEVAHHVVEGVGKRGGEGVEGGDVVEGEEDRMGTVGGRGRFLGDDGG
jgi:hypothetical protein